MIDMISIMKEIEEEIGVQYSKWGIQNHHPDHWVTILGEEFGEVCTGVLNTSSHEYRKELIHVAAVCASAIECLDRHIQKPKGETK